MKITLEQEKAATELARKIQTFPFAKRAIGKSKWTDEEMSLSAVLISLYERLSAQPSLPVEAAGPTDKQRKIDIANLRFYARMFREHEWSDTVIHWGVFEQTLNEIAARLETVPALPADTAPPKSWIMCEDCPRVGYPTHKTRCTECPRRLVQPPADTAPNIEALADKLQTAGLDLNRILSIVAPPGTETQSYDEAEEITGREWGIKSLVDGTCKGAFTSREQAQDWVTKFPESYKLVWRYKGWFESTPGKPAEPVRELEIALRNCRMLAQREIRRHEGGDARKPTGITTLAAWKHILRFCEEVGITGSILRGDADTSAAEGTK